MSLSSSSLYGALVDKARLELVKSSSSTSSSSSNTSSSKEVLKDLPLHTKYEWVDKGV